MKASIDLLNSQNHEAPSLDNVGSGQIIGGVKYYCFKKTVPAYGSTLFIVGSDRTLRHGVLEDKEFYELSDGNRIRLSVSDFCSWSPSSISKFIENASDSRESFTSLFVDVKTLISRAVCLDDLQLSILAVYVISSYFTWSFKALSYLHLRGGYGSGKSNCANTLLRLSFNSSAGQRLASYGKSTEAAIFRDIASSRGLAVLDDLELISQAKNSPLRQGLLVGYSRESATMTMVSRNKTQSWNLFSPRVFTSIGEAEPILKSRLLEIHLSPARPDFQPQEITEEEAASVRNRLYTYSMNPRALVALSEALTKAEEDRRFTGRLAQISSSLRAIAFRCDQTAAMERFLLSRRLADSQSKPIDLKTLVTSLLKDGFESLSVCHIQNLLALGGQVRSSMSIGQELATFMKPDSSILVHGFKSRTYRASARLKRMLALKPHRKARSFCPQAGRKKWQVDACSGCPWERVCPIKVKLSDAPAKESK